MYRHRHSTPAFCSCSERPAYTFVPRQVPFYDQIPHIDLYKQEIQICVSLSPSAAPTLAYLGSEQVSLGDFAKRMGENPHHLVWDNLSAFRQLTLSRETLLKGLRPAIENVLDVGDAFIMRGGVVHARPKL